MQESVKLRQVHGGQIVRITAHNMHDSHEGDGLVTQEPGITLSIYTADCLPLSITTSHEVGLFHVSRKTLIAGLLEKVPDVMDARDIQKIEVGPHICAEHFSFAVLGPDIQKFAAKFPTAVYGKDPLHISLLAALTTYLEQWQVLKEKISVDNTCTYESLDLPSYRREFEKGNPTLKEQIITTIAI
jgi:copper oxidase (laccase) domain-containing protein